MFESRETIEAASERLTRLLLDVASGTATFGEILNEGEDVVSRLGPSL